VSGFAIDVIQPGMKVTVRRGGAEIPKRLNKVKKISRMRGVMSAIRCSGHAVDHISRETAARSLA
jgi:hypothetical protein